MSGLTAEIEPTAAAAALVRAALSGCAEAVALASARAAEIAARRGGAVDVEDFAATAATFAVVLFLGSVEADTLDDADVAVFAASLGALVTLDAPAAVA